MMKMWSKSYIMRGTRAWKTFSEMILNFIFFFFFINVQVHGSRDSQHNLVNSLMQDLINEGKTIQCMYYVLDPGKKYHNDECILPIINIDYKIQRYLYFSFEYTSLLNFWLHITVPLIGPDAPTWFLILDLSPIQNYSWEDINRISRNHHFITFFWKLFNPEKKQTSHSIFSKRVSSTRKS